MVEAWEKEGVGLTVPEVARAHPRHGQASRWQANGDRPE